MSEQPQVIRREDYKEPDFVVEKVELVFDLERDVTNVKSRLFVAANPARGTGKGDEVFLHGEDMKLLSVTLDGDRLASSDFTVDADKKAIVDTVLGLYSLCLGHKGELLDRINSARARAFPKEYFGDLPALLEMELGMEPVSPSPFINRELTIFFIE